jgi:YidC/Oxa1 family membrane protein insertase
MDRNTVIGFVLIGLVLMVWMYMNAPPPKPVTTGQDTTSVTGGTPGAGSSGNSQAPPRSTTTGPAATTGFPPQTETSGSDPDSLGKFFRAAGSGERKFMTLESGLWKADLSTLGGGISSWQLNNYFTWYGDTVRYFDRSEHGSLNMFFLSADGKRINTRNLYFTSRYTRGQRMVLGEKDSVEIEFTLQVSSRSSIVKKLTFHGDSYEVGVSYRFVNMDDVISNFKYIVMWESGLHYFEHNSVDESNYAKAAAFAGGEETEVDASDVGEPVKKEISGLVKWTGIRNKYFVVALIPRLKETQGAFLEGKRTAAPDQGMVESYTMGVEMPFVGKTLDEDRYTLYLGPLDYDLIRSMDVNLDRIMSLGSVWIIRPISQYFIIPIFQFLHWFIPNYGIVLIIFAFIIKVILHPLTKKSMQSMQKMQALQPMMTEIREKHKEDPQKMNQAMMRLYKEYGVNPAGGCLPMLLQLPILYALWAVFGSTIELRQAHFIWWIQDLAAPDVILALPAKIPIFGIDKISGLALAMGVTMFIQQKMTVKDPKQKMMVWMMPVMMTLLFTNFPSGLNLYYFVFNLLSIVQQTYMNKKHEGEPLRKVEEKKRSGGWISKLSQNLPQQRKR